MARTNKLVQPLSQGVWGMQDKSIIIIIIILMSTETGQKYYYGELNHISNEFTQGYFKTKTICFLVYIKDP